MWLHWYTCVHPLTPQKNYLGALAITSMHAQIGGSIAAPANSTTRNIKHYEYYKMISGTTCYSLSDSSISSDKCSSIFQLLCIIFLILKCPIAICDHIWMGVMMVEITFGPGKKCSKKIQILNFLFSF